MQMLAKAHVRPEVPKAINILYVPFWVTSYGLLVDQQAVVLYSKDASRGTSETNYETTRCNIQDHNLRTQTTVFSLYSLKYEYSLQCEKVKIKTCFFTRCYIYVTSI